MALSFSSYLYYHASCYSFFFFIQSSDLRLKLETSGSFGDVDRKQLHLFLLPSFLPSFLPRHIINFFLFPFLTTSRVLSFKVINLKLGLLFSYVLVNLLTRWYDGEHEPIPINSSYFIHHTIDIVPKLIFIIYTFH